MSPLLQAIKQRVSLLRADEKYGKLLRVFLRIRRSCLYSLRLEELFGLDCTAEPRAQPKILQRHMGAFALLLLFPLLWQLAEPAPLQVSPPAVLLVNPDARQGAQALARFTCLEVQEDDSLRRPREDVIWLKDSEIINTASRKYRNYGRKKKLEIRNPMDEDQGVYECTFSLSSTERGRAELWIAPRILEAPPVQRVPASGNATVVCSVSGGVRVVEWRGEGGGVIASTTTEEDSRYSILSNGSLLISDVQLSDEGNYTCIVSNRAGEQSAEIAVITGAPEDPIIQTPPIESDNTTPAPPLPPNPEPDNCVDLPDISFTSHPSYPTHPPSQEPPVATATIPQGMATSMLQTPPQFTLVSPPCVRTLVGYTIVLNCSATGYPQPEISWLKGRRNITSRMPGSFFTADGESSPYEILQDGSLKFQVVQSSDQGEYTCQATNQMGSVITTVRVKVVMEGEVCGRSSAVPGGGGRGAERRKRITEGEHAANITDWPWQVLMEYPTLETSEELLCGGALLRPDWVVTAAHCLYYYTRWLEPREIYLRAGVHNRSNDEPSQQRLEVQAHYRHPNYTVGSTSFEYDIALIKLRHPVKLTDSVGLICLPPLRWEDPPPGTLCTVTGWGHLEFRGGWSPDVLHEAQVPIVSHSHCRHPQSYNTRYITRNILCAGYQEGGADACQNDSGGPLVCHIAERWRLYGVVNHGQGCGDPYKYGLYARVSKYIRWINSFMQLHS